MRVMFRHGIKSISLTIVMAFIALTIQASAFVLPAHRPVQYVMNTGEGKVVMTAFSLLQTDLQRVLDAPLQANEATPQLVIATNRGTGAELLASTGVDCSSLTKLAQAFIVAVSPRGQLVIAGSDSYGTAYGIIELTRLLGVSAWEWWADVDVEPKDEFRLAENFITQQAPNVTFRGIFINDEDWGLMPWSATNFEPSTYGQVGPKTTERIFELLLRLRANLYWPPMHECTRPFFLTEGCRELASRYGICIGTSHCEPMGCNVLGEWKLRGHGEYDWNENRAEVLRFWETRVKEVARQPMVYTLGMRGIHDSALQGVYTVEEQKRVLEQVIAEQRQLLAKNVNPNIAQVPQVFIPYKEVMDAYKAGLQVPDDVTLMWCDDNYGYIRHFPTPEEANRPGGNGIYYHVSYWGRPHDYLWLGSASPFLMYQQLSEAYNHGADRMWVLNVGDLKPLEYQISLFMDMAWSMERVTKLTIGTHLEEFFAQTIGRDVARLSSIYMKESYHLAFQMKPEHMAGTRVEEPKGGNIDWNAVHDLPWSEAKIRHRLTRYDRLQRNATWIGDSVRKTHPNRADAYFQLVEYPILASAAQNEKYLCAQLARHGIPYLQRDNVASTWERSDLAHNRVQELTIRYNEQRQGKWRGIMSSNPRNLPVFQPVPHKQVMEPMFEDPETITSFYGASYDVSSFAAGDVLAPVLGLGASIRAMPIPKNCYVTYKYKYNYLASQFANIEIRLLPTHPIEEAQRFMLTFDGSAPQTFTYETEGRNEQWKRNVLRNYAVVLVRFPISQPNGVHELKLTALDDGVVVDEIFIRK